jgi:transcriptional regulator with XRE-family HTH domain
MIQSEYAVKIIKEKMIMPKMKEMGISKYRLAKISGLSESMVGKWLSGKVDISLTKFIDVLTALEINIELKDKCADNEYQNRVFFN